MPEAPVSVAEKRMLHSRVKRKLPNHCSPCQSWVLTDQQHDSRIILSGHSTSYDYRPTEQHYDQQSILRLISFNMFSNANIQKKTGSNNPTGTRLRHNYD